MHPMAHPSPPMSTVRSLITPAGPHQLVSPRSHCLCGLSIIAKDYEQCIISSTNELLPCSSSPAWFSLSCRPALLRSPFMSVLDVISSLIVISSCCCIRVLFCPLLQTSLSRFGFSNHVASYTASTLIIVLDILVLLFAIVVFLC